MTELYIFIGITVVIGGLWLQNKRLKAKARRFKVKAHSAERKAEHHEEIAKTTNLREKEKPKAIKEQINESVNDDFSDFYH